MKRNVDGEAAESRPFPRGTLNLSDIPRRPAAPAASQRRSTTESTREHRAYGAIMQRFIAQTIAEAHFFPKLAQPTPKPIDLEPLPTRLFPKLTRPTTEPIDVSGSA